MKEIWKQHYTGLLVSNLGKVFVPKSGSQPEHYTYGTEYNNGYLMIHIGDKRYPVHILVLETFCGISTKGLHVHHKNGNTKDNRLENLIALSKKDHYKIHGIERSKQILQFDPDDKFIREWPSTMEIERQLGYAHNYISKCCKGKYKTAYKYIWRYK